MFKPEYTLCLVQTITLLVRRYGRFRCCFSLQFFFNYLNVSEYVDFGQEVETLCGDSRRNGLIQSFGLCHGTSGSYSESSHVTSHKQIHMSRQIEWESVRHLTSLDFSILRLILTYTLA